MLAVFAVGTLNSLDTAEAAKWKKYDSGSFKTEYPEEGFKEKMSFVSYKKDSKNLKTNIYGYKLKNNKKTLLVTVYMIKTGKNVKTYGIVNGKKSKVASREITLKQCYQEELYAFKNGRKPSYYLNCC